MQIDSTNRLEQSGDNNSFCQFQIQIRKTLVAERSRKQPNGAEKPARSRIPITLPSFYISQTFITLILVGGGRYVCTYSKMYSQKTHCYVISDVPIFLKVLILINISITIFRYYEHVGYQKMKEIVTKYSL